MPAADPLLRADCAACVAWCCVALPFAASADFPIDKPAGRACRHLGSDDRCGIHDTLPARGFHGCVAFDCFGAGQRVTLLTAGDGGWRSGDAPSAFVAFDAMRTLHELLWYLDDALDRVPDELLHAARARTAELSSSLLEDLVVADIAGHRAEVAPLLRAASARVRGTARPRCYRAGVDLAGADLRGVDLSDEDLRGALLIGADLTGARLERTDLLGADLRGTDLSGADLSEALFVTRAQVGAARLDAATCLPVRLR